MCHLYLVHILKQMKLWNTACMVQDTRNIPRDETRFSIWCILISFWVCLSLFSHFVLHFLVFDFLSYVISNIMLCVVVQCQLLQPLVMNLSLSTVPLPFSCKDSPIFRNPASSHTTTQVHLPLSHSCGLRTLLPTLYFLKAPPPPFYKKYPPPGPSLHHFLNTCPHLLKPPSPTCSWSDPAPY